ncbi:MAG TPA: carboxypeptidase regulatory-like domain-containing protein [Burkholderiales bacterium]|nr:carboxypeptidase regulatory-like domain-containing protein [Burkholderiales bacterium]
MKPTSLLFAGALAAALALPATAATMLMHRTALPELKTEGNITYMSGGIGKPESTAMKAEAKHYPLSMIFSGNKDNEYLADVHVTIQDHTGKDVLSTVSEGPIMLVKLPAGRYTVIADANGKSFKRAVLVRETGERQLSFHWPQV